MDASMLSEILESLRSGDATLDDQQHAADTIEFRGLRIMTFEAALRKWRDQPRRAPDDPWVVVSASEIDALLQKSAVT